jgi:hypothetical protein
MDLGESFRIWRRRRILTIAMLILALAGSATALTGLPRAYQSDSSVILLASRSAAKLNGGNPYLSFSPSLTLTADALSRQLMAPATARDLAARGFVGAYTVALAPDTTATTGSVLLISVTSNSSSVAVRTLQAVTSEISVKLSQLQSGVAARNQIRAAALSYTPQATLSSSQTARPLVAVTVLGLLAALGIPIAVDGLLARRRIRNAAMIPDPAEGPAVDGQADDDRDFAGRQWDSRPPGRNGSQSRRAPRAGR